MTLEAAWILSFVFVWDICVFFAKLLYNPQPFLIKLRSSEIHWILVIGFMKVVVIIRVTGRLHIVMNRNLHGVGTIVETKHHALHEDHSLHQWIILMVTQKFSSTEARRAWKSGSKNKLMREREREGGREQKGEGGERERGRERARERREWERKGGSGRERGSEGEGAWERKQKEAGKRGERH